MCHVIYNFRFSKNHTIHINARTINHTTRQYTFIIRGNATKSRLQEMKQSPKELKHQDDLRRIFIKELDKDELLLKDYSCTYHKDIIIRGRLYITSRMICFHSSVLGWGNQLTIPFENITSILKRRIVLLLPNALAICANGKKFVFSSFKNRNQAFNHLFKVWQNVLMNNPLSPEGLYAHINDKTAPVVATNSNISVTGNFVSTTTAVVEVIKENESDSSNDGLVQQPSKGLTRTNGNNSDGYFTEEHINTSVEDVSTVLLPVTMDYSSSTSQADSDICDSDSNLELKLGLTHEEPILDAAKLKLKASNVTEMLPNASSTGHSGIHTIIKKYIQKHCTSLNMLNLLMILMICLVIFTTGLLLCELSAVDPNVNEILSWLPGLSKWCYTQQRHMPNDLRVQLEMVHQLSTDLRILLLQYFNDNKL